MVRDRNHVEWGGPIAEESVSPTKLRETNPAAFSPGPGLAGNVAFARERAPRHEKRLDCTASYFLVPSAGAVPSTSPALDYAYVGALLTSALCGAFSRSSCCGLLWLSLAFVPCGRRCDAGQPFAISGAGGASRGASVQRCGVGTTMTSVGCGTCPQPDRFAGPGIAVLSFVILVWCRLSRRHGFEFNHRDRKQRYRIPVLTTSQSGICNSLVARISPPRNISIESLITRRLDARTVHSAWPKRKISGLCSTEPFWRL